MNASWFRRIARVATCAAALALLGACGSGSVVSDLNPQRFITVGDGFMDVGQKDGVRYSVNDGSANWVEQFVSYYGKTITPASTGGFGYAQGHARVAQADASGAPSVTAQIDSLLARTPLSATEDVVIVGGGIADIVAAVAATGISQDTTDAVSAAGQALGDQVRRLVNAGAAHVLVVGVYNLGNTPWAGQLGQRDAITDLSVRFNDALAISIVDLGQNVLFVDPALLHNLMYNEPANYAFDNGVDPVCTTPDASTCTPNTVVQGADYNRWMYADNLYFTPRAARHFGSSDYGEGIYNRFKERW